MAGQAGSAIAHIRSIAMHERWMPLTSIFLLLVLMLVPYVTGYFWLGHVLFNRAAPINPPRRTIARCYRQKWLVIAYRPLAVIESMVTDRDVVTDHLDGISRAT